MKPLKLANWNIEWMNDWFRPVREGAPAWRQDNPGRGITNISALVTRVAAVIKTIAPDVLAIQEGPSRLGEMQLFVDDYLDRQFEIQGPTGRGSQRLYTLIRKDGPIDSVRRIWPEPGQIDFDESWPVDVTGDLIVEGYEFTRQPLEIEVIVNGKPITIFNLHTKSKYVHGGRALYENLATRSEYIAQAVRNRRRIAAELMRMRARVDEILSANLDAKVIVCGDLNDGPGVDFFEQHYLIHNVVSVVAGSPFVPQHMLRHAFIDREVKDRNFTARFDDFIDNIRDRPLLLDHILLSPGLYWGALRNARIEHEVFEAQLRPDKRGREAHPSDHRPQSATLEL